MHALNHTLEAHLLDADGRYLEAQELQPLERYLQTFETRLNAYQYLRENSEKLVIYALRKTGQSYPDLIQQHGARCKYDMTEVLRYLALSALRDDEMFFKEQMLSWLDTVLLAHKRQLHCVYAYRQLQDAIAKALPTAEANLLRSYLDGVIQTLDSHA
jgi:hypothetical protein